MRTLNAIVYSRIYGFICPIVFKAYTKDLQLVEHSEVWPNNAIRKRLSLITAGH